MRNLSCRDQNCRRTQLWLEKPESQAPLLSFVINPDGSVAEVQALSGHPMLKTAAAANVATWRFRPEDGRGERQTTELVFKFSGKDVSLNPRLTVSLESFRRIEVTTDVVAYPAQPVVRRQPH
jgi:hypothetical protein